MIVVMFLLLLLLLVVVAAFLGINTSDDHGEQALPDESWHQPLGIR